MVNPFSVYASGILAPASTMHVVIKSDTADLPGGVCRSLLVGTPGTANLIDAAGNQQTNVPLQQGFNPIGVARIMTGGTADNIWALY